MKKIILVFAIIWIIGLTAILAVLKLNPLPKPDTSAINDAIMSGASINEIIITEYDRINTEVETRDNSLQYALVIYILLTSLLGTGLFLYCEYLIIAPFRKLKSFARDIASGNLDVPLMMDKKGIFGAFTESFDLMREELHLARENERAAERSKKELVASLSHDIKTPVASIKATTELMLINVTDEKTCSQLEQINAKAGQIDTLITDMFHSTLEELKVLTVTPVEIHSTIIPALIKNADYKNHINSLISLEMAIPECIIIADPARLQQVFDNIIINSYKYADTSIDITQVLENENIVITIADSGPGIPDDEIPLLANKFYRGQNASAQSGYGLGLHISKFLLTEMQGDLSFENASPGFSAKITLKLA